eukprot:UN03861
MSLSAALHRISEMWLCPPHHKLLILIQLWSTKLTDTILQKRGKNNILKCLNLNNNNNNNNKRKTR